MTFVDWNCELCKIGNIKCLHYVDSDFLPESKLSAGDIVICELCGEFGTVEIHDKQILGIEMDDDLKRKANHFFYNMTKHYAMDSFTDRLEACGLSFDDWDEIKKELAKIGITKTKL